MGDRRAHDPASETWWAQTVGERARGAKWDLLHPVDGMPMEGAAERSAAKEYSARLSGAVYRGCFQFRPCSNYSARCVNQLTHSLPIVEPIMPGLGARWPTTAGSAHEYQSPIRRGVGYSRRY